MNQSRADSISQRLRTQLSSQARLSVVNPMTHSSYTQKDNAADTYCHNEVCAADRAAGLGAQQAIIGLVKKLPNHISFELTCFDIVSGRTICEFDQSFLDKNYHPHMTIAEIADSVGPLLHVSRNDYGTLTLTTHPAGAWVKLGNLLIDSVDSLRKLLYRGTCDLRVGKSGYLTLEDSAVISAGKTLYKQYTLKPDPRIAVSSSISRRERRWRMMRIGLASASLGCLAAGIYFDYHSRQSYDEHIAARNAYFAARPGDDFDGLYYRYEQQFDEYELNHSIKNKLLGAAAGFGIVLGFSFYF
ncbi:MAG: hypothetical protein GF398_21020 [Chitinivibrionales bacterium]|nr:hypothetical protein [Chitinivibrionales bacterium]